MKSPELKPMPRKTAVEIRTILRSIEQARPRPVCRHFGTSVQDLSVHPRIERAAVSHYTIMRPPHHAENYHELMIGKLIFAGAFVGALVGGNAGFAIAIALGSLREGPIWLLIGLITGSVAGVCMAWDHISRRPDLFAPVKTLAGRGASPGSFAAPQSPPV